MTREEAIKIANKTCRDSGGAVGSNPICYHWVIDNGNKMHRILDYGAGKNAVHTLRLRDEGFDTVHAYEIGDNYVAGTHTADPTEGSFRIVIASNVLNVIPDMDMLVDTIKDIYKYVDKEGGIIVFNYPSSPRKLGLTIEQVSTAFLILTGLRPHRLADNKNLYCLDTTGGKYERRA